MNERIKELAVRAGFMLWQDENWNPGDVIDWSARYDDELAKFAELIVRECTVIMHKDTSPNCPYVDYFKVTNEIKQHFEVEE